MQQTIGKTAQRSNPTAVLQSRRRFLAGTAAISAAGFAPVAWAAPSAANPSGVSLSVDKRGETIHVQAQADVAASRALTFATLADYDHLADFIPGLASSRTVSRDRGNAVVEQRGRAAFGPFEQRFTVLLAIEEELDASIRASLAGGDFRRFEAVYEIQSLDSALTRVVYRAALEPSAGVPPLVGVPIMRGMIRSQFEALMTEIVRRSAVG